MLVLNFPYHKFCYKYFLFFSFSILLKTYAIFANFRANT
nr:MAG TPA: hypothetical protein [Caudoviricetes sp.]